MQYTLSSRGVALGHTALDLPTGTPQTLAGFFHPTDALATVGAPLLALAAEFGSLPGALREAIPSRAQLAEVPPEERGVRIQAALRADPRAQRRVQLQGAVEALALKLEDEHRALLPTKTVLLAPFPLPATLPANVTAEAVLSAFREDSAESGVAATDLMILVTRATPEAGAA
jgi:hypothetical protein